MVECRSCGLLLVKYARKQALLKKICRHLRTRFSGSWPTSIGRELQYSPGFKKPGTGLRPGQPAICPQAIAESGSIPVADISFPIQKE